jgi:hypothetical protein
MKNASERFIRSAHVRLDQAEDSRFQEMVQHLQTSRSQLLRKMIRELIGEGPDLLPQEFKVLDEAVYQIAAIGRNLNQLLRAVHAGQVKAVPQDQTLMGEILNRIESLKNEFLIVMDRSRNRTVRREP